MVNKITDIEIIKLFLNDYSRRIYLREIASLLGKPHQTVKPYIKNLVNKKVLIEERRKNVLDYSLNFKSKKIYEHLIIAEKEKTMELLDKEAILNILYEKLYNHFKNNSFIIFGSASINIKKASDIDLLIIGKENISNTVKEFEEIYNKKVHKVQVNNLKEVGLALINEIYKKHIILNNTEKIVRFFGEQYEQNKLV